MTGGVDQPTDAITPTGDGAQAAVFDANLDTLPAANRWLSARCAALNIVAKTAFALELCLEEIFVNVVIHGGAGHVRLSLERDQDSAVLRIADDGRAFDTVAAPAQRVKDPLDTNAIGGLGIGLVKQFARALHYSREKDMNCLTLEIALIAP